jgi:hypothetical protein
MTTKSTVFKFKDLGLAESFVNRCSYPMRIVMGDHPMYWVVTPADAQRLVKAGYELI